MLPSAVAARNHLFGIQTAGYRPVTGTHFSLGSTTAGDNYGAFRLEEVEEMRKHYHVDLGLGFKSAPIYTAEIEGKCRDRRILEYVTESRRRFWVRSLETALECQPYGYNGSEVLYRERKGLVYFDMLKPILWRDARPRTWKGKLVAVRVRGLRREPGDDAREDPRANSYVDLPTCGEAVPAKGAWFTHHARYNYWYGSACLLPTWFPWRAATMPDGLLEDVLKFAYKHSVSPTIFRYPNETYIDENGVVRQAGDLARQMAEMVKAGGVVGLSSDRDQQGNYKYMIEQWAKVEGKPEGLLAVVDFFDRCILRGLGIPDEILSHEGNTGGYSRSQIAASAFLINCEKSLNHLLEAFDDQILRPLVRMNFGDAADDYTLEAKPLVLPDQQPGGAPATGASGMPGQSPPGGQPGGKPTQPLQFSQLGAEPLSPDHWGQIVSEQAVHVRIVGETASGKSMLAQALMGSLPGKFIIIDPVYSRGSWGGLPAVTVGADGEYGPIEETLDGLLAVMRKRGAELQQGKTSFERLNIIWDEVPDTVAELPEAGLLIRRLGQRGRHSDMHIIGIGQSDRVNSWGIAGYGDAAENFCTIFLGRKAIEAMPDLAGEERPGVLEWRGKRYAIDLSEVPALARRPIPRSRLFELPKPEGGEGATEEAEPVPAKVEMSATATEPKDSATDPGRALATLYADAWNLIEEAGQVVPREELEAALEELAETDWVVNYDDATGKWTAAPAEGVEMAVHHAPKGGITLNGKHYRGGQFIPEEALEGATTEEKAKVEAGQKAKGERLRARGSVDAEALAARLAKHKGEPLGPFAKRSMQQAFAALYRHHGELTLHRIEELAGVLEKALAGVPEDQEGLREQFRQRLQAYGEMIELAKGKGVTGEIEAPAVPEPAPEPEPEKIDADKPLSEMTAGEALMAKASYAEWAEAVSGVAIDDNGNILKPEKLKMLQDAAAQYLKSQEIAGRNVMTDKGPGHVIGFTENGDRAIVEHPDGTQSTLWADGISSLSGYIKHELDKGNHGHPDEAAVNEFAKVIAQKMIDLGGTLDATLRENGIEPTKAMRIRGAISQAAEALRSEKSKPSEMRQRAMDRAREVQAAEENAASTIPEAIPTTEAPNAERPAEPGAGEPGAGEPGPDAGVAGATEPSGRPELGSPGSGDSARARTEGRIVTARAEFTRPGNSALVPESLRGFLNEHQIDGTAKAIEAMDLHGGFLLADGTGVGKTRQQLAVAQTYAEHGLKVLIVSPKQVINPDKKGNPTGSFANDSAAMGISLSINKGDEALAAGGVQLCTYEALAKIKDKIDDSTVVLFDESHLTKNWDSARSKHAREMSEKARAVMYATATPGDQPLHIAHLFRAKVFGPGSRGETFEELGLHQKEVRIPGGQTVKVWENQPGITNAEVRRRLDGLFDRMTQDGLMVRREISFQGVDVQVDQIKMEPEVHKLMEDIEERLSKSDMSNEGLRRAQILFQQRLQQEPHKIPHAINAAKEELAQGRSVIIFMARVNKSEVGGEEGDEEISSEGTAKTLRAELEKAGITDIAEIHGGNKKGIPKAVDDFQSGKARVVIATVESGGTGINLDDQTGDRPRSMIMMTPPFSANSIVQALGRGWRLNTKSNFRARCIYGDTTVDQWNAALAGKKLKLLNATVKGELQDLKFVPESSREDIGEKHEIPYEWQPLVGPEATGRTTMPFGKHQGKRLADVPRDYLQWLSGQELREPLKSSIKAHLKTTQPAPKPPAPAPVPMPAAAQVTATPAPPAMRTVKTVTEDQRAAIHEALRSLAGNDLDRARMRNDVGFNQMDSEIGGRLAAQDTLTDAEAERAESLLRKYHRQIPAELLKKAGAYQEKKEEAPPLNTRKVSTSRGERHVYSFPPSQSFWAKWKGWKEKGGKPEYLSVGKNPRSGDWEATVWGESPEQIAEHVEKLRGQGLNLSHGLFDEQQHPRDESGEFTTKGGGKDGKTTATGKAAFQAIGHGNLGYVHGFPVRRTGKNEWRVETETGHVTGSAEKVQTYLDKQWEDQKPDRRRSEAALARADSWEEPEWHTEAAREADDAWAALPRGTRVVVTDGERRGRLGTIARDATALGEPINKVKLDGEIGLHDLAAEPLDPKLSWRVPREELSEEEEADSRRPLQGLLFSSSANDWTAYTGPRGGRGWKHVGTGRIIYGAKHPSERTRRKAEPGTQRPAVEDLHARIHGFHDGKKPLSDDQVAGEVASIAQHMRIWEVHDLAEKMGLDPGAKESKTSMLAKIEGKLRSKAGKEAALPPRVGIVPTDQLHVDPERFQYKLNVAGPHGVGEELKGVRAFNPDLAGVLMVWRDPENKKDFVVNGHHRYDLAKRLGHPEMLVRYVDAADAKQARAKGALANIAEGRGTAVDAAKFMRDTGTSAEDLAKVGVSLKGSVARDAQALARLDDSLFRLVTTGGMREQQALAISSELENPADQRALYQYIQKMEAKGKRVADDVVREAAIEVKETPKHTESVATLFGTEENEQTLFLERNQLKAAVRDSLAKEAGIFKAVSSEGKAEVLKRGENVINPEQNKKIAEAAEHQKNYFDRLINRKGPLADALNEATEEFGRAKRASEKQAIRARLLEKMRGLMETEGIDK